MAVKTQSSICSTIIYFSAIILIFHLFAIAVYSSSPANQTAIIKPNPNKSRIIQGWILSKETSLPIESANVSFNGKKITDTDSTGFFKFTTSFIGTFSLEVSMVGYSSKVIRSNDKSVKFEIVFKMQISPVESENIVVLGKNVSHPLRSTVNSTTIKPETISDLPGVFGDITRFISNTVSLSKVDDRYNSMNVRGGSAIENGYYIDNIEISNMNHFPSQGSGSGPLGLIRADIIDDVVFHTGGFPVQYGNKLSSIMDIKLRKGGEDGFHAKGILDLTGISATAEGKIFNNKGNWLLSSRRGFLGDLIDFDGNFDYFDLEGRFEYNVNPKSNLSVLMLGGKGKYDLSRTESITTGNAFYGLFDYKTGLIGSNWTYRQSGKMISQTSIAYSFASWKNDNEFRNGDNLLLENESYEKKIKLRHSSIRSLQEKTSVLYGFDLDYNILKYDYVVGEFISSQGYKGDSIEVNENKSILNSGTFLNISQELSDKITFDFGLRLDHSEFNGSTLLAPKGGVEFKLNEHHNLYSRFGKYNQSLPLMLVFQTSDNRLLKNPKAFHFVLGWKSYYQGIGSLSVELYNKQYSDMPMDTLKPQAFILDELVWNYGFMAGHNNLVSTGKAFSRGVEINGETLFSQKISSQFGIAYFRSRYLDFNGDWRDRIGDNKLLINILLKYNPSKNWSFITNWMYAGGVPYTPTYQESEYVRYNPDDINRGRLPDYHVLNVKCTKRFSIKKSVLSLYVELINVYNRRNVSPFNVQENTNSCDGDSQIPFLPIVGMEYSF